MSGSKLQFGSFGGNLADAFDMAAGVEPPPDRLAKQHNREYVQKRAVQGNWKKDFKSRRSPAPTPVSVGSASGKPESARPGPSVRYPVRPAPLALPVTNRQRLTYWDRRRGQKLQVRLEATGGSGLIGAVMELVCEARFDTTRPPGADENWQPGLTAILLDGRAKWARVTRPLGYGQELATIIPTGQGCVPILVRLFQVGPPDRPTHTWWQFCHLEEGQTPDGGWTGTLHPHAVVEEVNGNGMSVTPPVVNLLDWKLQKVLKDFCGYQLSVSTQVKEVQYRTMSLGTFIAMEEQLKGMELMLAKVHQHPKAPKGATPSHLLSAIPAVEKGVRFAAAVSGICPDTKTQQFNPADHAEDPAYQGHLDWVPMQK